MISPVEYYYDKDHTRRVTVNEEGMPVIDWGEIVPGKSKQVELHALNKSRDKIAIRQPYTTKPELKIIDYPSRLFGQESGIVKFQLSPPIPKHNEDFAGHTASWGFEIVIG